jgi:hypothetical protein
MLIDEQLPTWERRVLRGQPVNQPAETVFAAIRRVDFFRSPVIARGRAVRRRWRR